MAARKGKGILALIAGPMEKGAGGGGKDDDMPMGKAMGMEAKELAMEDFAEALEAKDTKAMAKAFKRAYDACRAAEESEGYNPGGEGGEDEED